MLIVVESILVARLVVFSFVSDWANDVRMNLNLRTNDARRSLGPVARPFTLDPPSRNHDSMHPSCRDREPTARMPIGLILPARAIS